MKNKFYYEKITGLVLTFCFLFLTSCGGGSSNSGSATNASSIGTGTLVFTGTDLNAGTTYQVALLVNPINNTYSVVNSEGNETSGGYSSSGSTITVNNGTLYVYPCTSSSCTTYQVSQSTLTLSGTSLSGTVTLNNGAIDSLSLTAQSTFNQSNVSLSSFFGKSFSQPSGSNCGSSSLVGSTSYTISGVTLVVSCNASSSNKTLSLTTCGSLGTDCSPNSFLTSNGISIPSQSLVYYTTCTGSGCPSSTPYSAGYIRQASAGANALSIKALLKNLWVENREYSYL